MNLLINEWRKYFRNVRSAIILPLIQLTVLLIFYVILANRKEMPIDIKAYNQPFYIALIISCYFINFISVIYASNILSSEISRGTIKFVLTRPYLRYKILVAKIGAVSILMPIFMIISIAIILLLQFITMKIMPEFKYLIYYTTIFILSIFAITAFFTSLALMLSAMSGSPSFVTGCCFVYYLFASRFWKIINYLYFKLPTDGWIYILNPMNTNNYIINALLNITDNTLQSKFFITLFANIVYAVIFLFIAIFVFRRRDISLAN